ncbi:PREDICTED: M-phase phosphoprotein 6 [Vollenhovia emeryi]|uniref:M-phase phosphoprotein 6 n=1 Tax=Vollenhovia emeryi TaxID=411798 RepID=UPI0005F46A3E|nr:PREDICTED: M-phase phosphoprotein 6 [Vollenhovia emeryi]
MDSKRITLSKSILEMKFMKRTKDKVEKEQFQEEGEEYFGNQLTSRMKKASGKFLMEPSYVFCEKLVDGRISFQGMNPAIEKLMEARKNAKQAKVEVKQDADISDEQMAVQWKKMRAKFDTVNRRRKPQHRTTNNEDEPFDKKPKFLKPADWNLHCK